MKWGQTAWIQFPVLPLASSEILGKRFHLCLPWILHQKMGIFIGYLVSIWGDGAWKAPGRPEKLLGKGCLHLTVGK